MVKESREEVRINPGRLEEFGYNSPSLGGPYKNDNRFMDNIRAQMLSSPTRREAKEELEAFLEAGIELTHLGCNTRKKVLNTRTYEALSEIFIAYMMRMDPERFVSSPIQGPDKTFFKPIWFKVYFYVMLINAAKFKA